MQLKYVDLPGYWSYTFLAVVLEMSNEVKSSVFFLWFPAYSRAKLLWFQITFRFNHDRFDNIINQALPAALDASK